MTCVVSERHKRMAPKGEDTDKKDEEEWPLKDVIFVEDVKTVPVGRVIKVDGDYAAVRFPSSKDNKEGSSKEQTATAEDPGQLLQECRLMRTDDLQVIKSGTTARSPDCFQKIPRKINIPDNGHILALTVDNQGKAECKYLAICQA